MRIAAIRQFRAKRSGAVHPSGRLSCLALRSARAAHHIESHELFKETIVVPRFSALSLESKGARQLFIEEFARTSNGT